MPRSRGSVRFIIELCCRRSLAEDPRRWSEDRQSNIKGVSEETTTGVHRLYQMQETRASSSFPAVNVNDSVTKSKFDNNYGCRESLIDGIERLTDVLIAGKTSLVAATAMSGKGAQSLLAAMGARSRHRNRPDLRPSGIYGRLPGRAVWMTLIRHRRHLRHRHRQQSILSRSHMERMKNQAIVYNIGHFDSEIDMAGSGLNCFPALSAWNIKPQVDKWVFP